MTSVKKGESNYASDSETYPVEKMDMNIFNTYAKASPEVQRGMEDEAHTKYNKLHNEDSFPFVVPIADSFMYSIEKGLFPDLQHLFDWMNENAKDTLDEFKEAYSDFFEDLKKQGYEI